MPRTAPYAYSPYTGEREPATEQLYESSLLQDGYLSDPHKLVNRINGILEKSSGWYTEIKKI